MRLYLTDGSFEGLLCAVFDSYNQEKPSDIRCKKTYQASMLDDTYLVITRDDIADRVVTGIIRVGGTRTLKILYKAFLSEFDDAQMLIYRITRRIMQNKTAAILNNFADPDILRLRQIIKMIGREVHRMHAFIRFLEAKNGQFYALIEPDFNVLPLLEPHFKDRYRSMAWTIFDASRGYGLRYDKQSCLFITDIDEMIDPLTGQFALEQLTDNEKAFQRLWQTYFSAVNIKSRENIKHHEQQLPRRYWKYLSEKSLVKEEVPDGFSLRNIKS